MQFVWKYIDDLVGKGLDFLTIAELMLYASASLVPLALPLAVLLSSIMTFGAMGEHYELVAIKSSGISLLRIMFPLIILVTGLSIGAFYFSNNIIPVANLKRSTLLFSIRQQKPALNIREGEFYQGIDGYSIKVGAKEEEGKILKDIIIYDHTGGNNKKVIRAEWGKMTSANEGRYLVFNLYKGHSYEEPSSDNKSKYPFLRTEFSEEEIRFDLSSFQLERAKEDIFKDHYRMMNINQLVQSMDSLNKKYSSRRQTYWEESKEKLKLALDSNMSPKYSKILETDTVTGFQGSVLASFDQKQHQRIIDAASNMVRNHASYSRTISREFKSREERIAVHEIEWHRKFTLSVACLLLFFVGAPLGAIIRKGGLGMPFIFSTVIFILYHVISMTTEKMAKGGLFDPVIGMWIASMIILPIGIFLTYQTNKDAKVMKFETYGNFFKKLFKKKAKA